MFSESVGTGHGHREASGVLRAAGGCVFGVWHTGESRFDIAN